MGNCFRRETSPQFAKEDLIPLSKIRYGSWGTMIPFYCLPKQSFPSPSKAYPCLHSHWKPPCALTHCPLLQMPCITHSFISIKKSSCKSHIHTQTKVEQLQMKIFYVSSLKKYESECLFCCFYVVQGGSSCGVSR